MGIWTPGPGPTSGDDTFQGDNTDEKADGGAGNDSLYGKGGDDRLISGIDGAGDDLLDGGEDDDTLLIARLPGSTDTINAFGQTGDDHFIIQMYGGTAHAYGGAGEDSFEIYAGGILNGGADTDTYKIADLFIPAFSPLIIIEDFETGENGDIFNIGGLLGSFRNWNTDNPFSIGHLQLIQQGDDSLLQIDLNGGADSWSDLIRFQNTQASAFITDNFDGLPIDGSAPAGLVLNGDSTANTLDGKFGADTIWGYDGNDRLDGHAGDDIVYGGDGNDFLTSGADGGGDDILDGERGDDTLIIRRFPASSDTVRAFGRGGDDAFIIQMYGGNAHAYGGPGEDSFEIYSGGNLTGGPDTDTYTLTDFYSPQLSSITTIRDFQTGTGGDIFNVIGLLDDLENWDGSNPFATGHLQLIRQGNHSLLQADVDGGADSWIDIAFFLNTQPAQFLEENFDGLPPDGSEPTGLTINGNDNPNTLEGKFGADTINGLGGNDRLDGHAGSDSLFGGDGNDRLTSGRDGAGDDILDGGRDNDTLIMHRYAASDDIVRAFGRGGDDAFTIQMYGGNAYAYGGPGEDSFDIISGGILVGGGDTDTFALSALYDVNISQSVLIRDFETGTGGDIFDINAFLPELQNLDGSNPFTTGHARLVQQGNHTTLQIDLNGGADSWIDIALFLSTQADQFIGENFNGLEPSIASASLQGQASKSSVILNVAAVVPDLSSAPDVFAPVDDNQHVLDMKYHLHDDSFLLF